MPMAINIAPIGMVGGFAMSAAPAAISAAPAALFAPPPLFCDCCPCWAAGLIEGALPDIPGTPVVVVVGVGVGCTVPELFGLSRKGRGVIGSAKANPFRFMITTTHA